MSACSAFFNVINTPKKHFSVAVRCTIIAVSLIISTTKHGNIALCLYIGVLHKKFSACQLSVLT